MTEAVFLLAGLQGILMFVDEFKFHARRGLSGWEKWGHWADSAVFFLPIALTLVAAPSRGAIVAYVVLSVLSSLLITKDEGIHAKECEPGEHWVHSVLFIVHPCVLIGVGVLWFQGEALWLRQGMALTVLGFGVYQLTRKSARPSVNNDFYETLGERWYEDDAHAVALLRVEARQKLKYVREVFETLQIPKTARVLDVGCGAGFISNPLATAGYDVTGIDLSENALEIARAKSARARYEKLSAYELGQGEYDVVLMLDVLEHLDDPRRAVTEAARVLKPGGALLFHTFNRTPLSWLLAVHGIRFVTKDCPSHVHVYHLFLKPEELKEMGREAGLSEGGWRGIAPHVWHRPFWWSLYHRRVHPSFEFCFTRSLVVGYLGYFTKRGLARR